MTSPLAARWRLAGELRRLRDQAGLTSAQLARAAGLVRQRLSALENAHLPVNVTEMCRVLDALGVADDRWRSIMDTAVAAEGAGWWETTGIPAAVPFVDLEAGASTVWEYQRLLVPAALQTAHYARCRASTVSESARVVDSLRIRQRLLLGPVARTTRSSWPRLDGMSGPFPPSHVWPVGGGLQGRLAAAISAAVSVEMTRYAATRTRLRVGSALPPLVWDRGADGAAVGAAGEATSVVEVEEALRPWARALGLTRQPSALTPVAGAIEYAGTVDQVRVRVWGVVAEIVQGTTETAG